MSTAGLPRRWFLAAGSVASVAAGGLLSQPLNSAMPGRSGAALVNAPIRIGQIGTGHAHASKLSVYRQSPDYEVVGIVEPDPQLREAAEREAAFRDVPWMTQEQLLNQPGLQAVLVETRVRDSLQAAAACVAAGCHVHLDKPAGESLSAFETLLQSAESAKLLVQLGYMYRYNPGFTGLHQLLEAGWLGEIFEVQAVMSKVVGAEDRGRLAEYPGGMMFELGCHLLDQVIRVLGAPQRVQGYARHSGNAEDSLKDNMLAVLEYPRALATVKSTALEIEGGSRRHFTVCGTAGTLHIQPLDAPSATLTLNVPRNNWKAGVQQIALPAYTRYVEDAAEMARIIRGEKAADYSYEHDLLVQKTLLQACGLV
ncbi:MAG: Gfo/Idh/MocA family protein [Planctomycetota bacterium]